MKHLNLDGQPEVIQQFVRALSIFPDGLILESAGHPVACVFPAPKVTTETNGAESDWTEEMNRRRVALLDRKYDYGLNAIEEAELTHLQGAMDHFIDRVAPLPLDTARLLHQELLQKAARAQNGNQT